MRRPLHWIVVSISLLVLFADRMLTTQPPEPAAQMSPFAWIREDGSEVYLPTSPPRAPGLVTTSQHGSTTHAVYTWSSPVAADDESNVMLP
ncbi:MAG TPA: hypothetical protein VM146_10335 [Steroidobacteraceae bacterium]|nr:hypothetical protein [Steroidobacteraceae bacterium]